jgi:hypothetical protein
MHALFRTFLAALACLVLTGCGGSETKVAYHAKPNGIVAYYPIGWIVTERREDATVDGRVIVGDDWQGIITEMGAYRAAAGDTPERHLNGVKARLKGVRNAEVGDVRVMFRGSYATLRWCAGGQCQIVALRVTIDDPTLLLKMTANWERNRMVNATPVEDLFRTADYR